MELADWKDNRAYRVAAFDRGHLSFVDETYVHDDDGSAAGAVVLITNPLDAQFLYGHKISGAMEAMAASTHVRALVFPPPGAQVVKVEARVDSEEFPMVGAEEGKPLYVAEWTPAKYMDGRLHKITGKSRQHMDVTSIDFVLSTPQFAVLIVIFPLLCPFFFEEIFFSNKKIIRSQEFSLNATFSE